MRKPTPPHYALAALDRAMASDEAWKQGRDVGENYERPMIHGEMWPLVAAPGADVTVLVYIVSGGVRARMPIDKLVVDPLFSAAPAGVQSWN